MKLVRSFPYILIGAAALWMGMWSGRSLNAFASHLVAAWQPGEARTSEEGQTTAQEYVRIGGFPLPGRIQEPTQDPTSHPPLPGSRPPGSASPMRQENLLIIGVDRLDDPTPMLKSVWLAIYMPDRPHFMILPVYPGQSSPASEQSPDPSLAMLFNLTPELSPGADFLKALEERELWWTHYLVLDETALAILVDETDRRPDKDQADGAQVVAAVPDPAEFPFQALLSQARLAQSLCLNSASLASGDPLRLSQLYDRVRQHISSDLDLSAALSEWAARLQFGAITCEFPSLTTAMLLP